MSDGPATTIRRRSRLQFSLRLLLLAFTAFAIGFPIWYRWPYEAEEIHYATTNGKPDTTRVLSRTVNTWQRQWGGGKKRHGPSRVWRASADVTVVEHFEHDVRSGPFQLEAGSDKTTGQFLDGKKHGEWRHSDDGKLLGQENYDRGVPHGFFASFEEDARFEYRVVHGQLDWKDRESQEHPLFRKVVAGAIAESQLLDTLKSPAAKDSGPVLNLNGSLENLAADLVQIHRIPIVIDPRVPLPTKPKPAGFLSPDLATFLLQTAQLHGVVLDYRYGCIWITTPDDAKGWRDPTGVAELQPPNGSSLAKMWNGRLDINVPGTDLPSALEALSKHVNGEIDCSQIAAGVELRGRPVRAKLAGLPLRHVLGLLLLESRCRCELRDGKLVVLPPEP
jgi:hypothetical protein